MLLGGAQNPPVTAVVVMVNGWKEELKLAVLLFGVLVLRIPMDVVVLPNVLEISGTVNASLESSCRLFCNSIISLHICTLLPSYTYERWNVSFT